MAEEQPHSTLPALPYNRASIKAHFPARENGKYLLYALSLKVHQKNEWGFLFHHVEQVNQLH
jgi:hypothetical protein